MAAAMTLLQILSGAIAGTTLMTLYSYIAAEMREKQFKEPVLLNRLVSQSVLIHKAVPSGNITGWLLHYMIGLAFIIIYHGIWQWTAVDPSYLHGALIGAASGLVGIIGWKMMFKLHSNPPRLDIGEYYLHLMIAHIIFGLGAVGGYRWAMA